MIVDFLNKPYPYFKNVGRNILSYFLIGAFVSAFLIVFEPFQIDEWLTPHKTLKLLGFGLVSFIVPTLLNFIIQYVVSSKNMDERWTVLKEIVVILIVLLGIAFGNLFYGGFLRIAPLGLDAFLMACTYTFLIGIFPVSIHVISKHNRFLKLSLQQTTEMNRQLGQQQVVQENNQAAPVEASNAQPAVTKLQLVADNEKDIFNIETDDLLFIESADNYSNIVFTENGSRKKQLLRSSLKRIENQITDQGIIRCHRGYIVNLARVKKVEGNAAGYKLFFYEGDDVVPVSRNYIALLNARLTALK